MSEKQGGKCGVCGDPFQGIVNLNNVLIPGTLRILENLNTRNSGLKKLLSEINFQIKVH